MDKYELTDDCKFYEGQKVYQIRALKDFRMISAGELGGYIKAEESLSQEGGCWVFPNSYVIDNASVSGNALVFENSLICGNASVGARTAIYSDSYIGGVTLLNEAETHIGPNACLINNNYWLKIVEVRGQSFTAYRRKDYGIGIRYQLFNGTIEEFEESLEEYLFKEAIPFELFKKIIELVQIRFRGDYGQN